MKRIGVPLFAFLLTCGACTKDDYGRSHSVLANRSAHRIVVTPYAGGVADSNAVRALLPGDSAYVYQTNSEDRDDVSPTWIDEALRRYDSVRVAFIDTTTGRRDTVRIAHVRAGISPAYPRYIPFTAARSLYNRAPWTEDVVDDSRYLFIARFTYTFTEADYQAAR